METQAIEQISWEIFKKIIEYFFLFNPWIDFLNISMAFVYSKNSSQSIQINNRLEIQLWIKTIGRRKTTNSRCD